MHLKNQTIEPHILYQSEEEYFGEYGDYITASKLKLCMQHGAAEGLKQSEDLGNINDIASDPFIVGSAVHCILLEGRDVFVNRYGVFNDNRLVNPKSGKVYGRSSNAFKRIVAEHNIKHSDMLSIQQFMFVNEVFETAIQNEVLLGWLTNGSPEVTVRSSIYDVPCQGKFDWYSNDYIVDIKTTSLGYDTKMLIEKWSYDIQFSLYSMLFEQLNGYKPEVRLIIIETRSGTISCESIGARDLMATDMLVLKTLQEISEYLQHECT